MSAFPPFSVLAALLVALAGLHPLGAVAQTRTPERVDPDRPISRGALGLPARGGPRDTVPAGTRGPTEDAAPRPTTPVQPPRPAPSRTP